MAELAKQITLYTSHAVEMVAAVIICVALLQVVWQYLRLPGGSAQRKEALRVQFGSSVAVALELLLGADVLSTAVAPRWNDIGMLAAIAVLRTALNYFLERELKQNEEREQKRSGPVTEERIAPAA